MGHYDDAREEYEERQYEEKAKRLGITVKELHEKENHTRKMMAGRKLWNSNEYEKEAIAYYLKHKDHKNEN